MAYYDSYYEDYVAVESPLLSEAKIANDVVRRRMFMILAAVVFVIVPLLVSVRPSLTAGVATESATAVEEAAVGTDPTISDAGAPHLATTSDGRLSSVFTPEVRHWEPQILAWSERYGLDPNLVAIIMQIESCGDPQAVSVAGAQGLFQVMPFHFAAGEDARDPETNAHRGLSYFVERLNQTGGDVGRAFAGYNGGHVAAAGGWDDWVHETQRYFVWSTGIYADIQSGQGQSSTVQEWLQAGGASLCRQAASRLGL